MPQKKKRKVYVASERYKISYTVIQTSHNDENHHQFQNQEKQN